MADNKSCPFCSSSNLSVGYNIKTESSSGPMGGVCDVWYQYVECRNCYARGPSNITRTRELAWAVWNQRSEEEQHE